MEYITQRNKGDNVWVVNKNKVMQGEIRSIWVQINETSTIEQYTLYFKDEIAASFLVDKLFDTKEQLIASL